MPISEPTAVDLDNGSGDTLCRLPQLRAGAETLRSAANALCSKYSSQAVHVPEPDPESLHDVPTEEARFSYQRMLDERDGVFTACQDVTEKAASVRAAPHDLVQRHQRSRVRIAWLAWSTSPSRSAARCSPRSPLSS